MTKKRRFTLTATLLALFFSPLLYAVEDCGTSVTECKLRQQIDTLQQQVEQLEQRLESVSQTTSQFFRDRLKDGGLGPEMVWIPAGSFMMGDIQGVGQDNEKPVHQVFINWFAMGRYEVTVAEFRRFVEASGYKTEAERGKGCRVSQNRWNWVKEANWHNPKFSQDDNHPVVCISWNDTMAYVEWLSQQTGKDYRLPSEAQWEYAARAGTMTQYWWGNEIGSNKINCGGNHCGDHFEYTAPVGFFDANPFGLFDMLGNVWEWCADTLHYNYNGAPTDGSVWEDGGSERRRLVRGGSWVHNSRDNRVAYRLIEPMDDRTDFEGFRVVRMWTEH